MDRSASSYNFTFGTKFERTFGNGILPFSPSL